MIRINEEKRHQFLAAQVRKQRNALLDASDGKMVPDSPFDKTAWLAYRQALRNITEQKEFPDNIVWPIEPTK